MYYKKNILSNLIVQILSIGIGFITSILIARGIGAENQGQFSYYLLIFGLIGTYGHLGITSSNSFFLKKTNYERNEILNTNISTLFILSIIYSILIILFKNQIFSSTTVMLLIIWNLYAIAHTFYNFFITIYVSEEKIYVYNRYNMFANIVKGLAIIIFFFINMLNILTLTIIYLLPEVLKCILMIKNIKYKFKFHINIKILKEEFKYGIPLYLGAMFIYLNYKVDQIMIKKYLGNSELGIYSIAVHLAELAFIFPEAIKASFEGNLYACEEDKRKVTCEKTIRFTFYITVLICIIGCLCKPLVTILYGQEYKEAGIVMVILLIGVAGAGIGKVAPGYFTTLGKPKVHFQVTSLVLIVNLIFNFILIPKIGIIGAAIASTISYSFFGIIYLIMLKRAGISIRRMILIQKSDFYTGKQELLKMIKKIVFKGKNI